MRGVLLAVAALVGCNAGEDVEASRVDVGAISVLPPAGWRMEERGPATKVWTPERNTRRESVTVLVGPRYLGGAERAFAAARSAQDLLHDGRIVSSERFAARSGLPGLRLDMTFRPDATNGVYRRSHAVLFVEDAVAGDYTVHVIYTAADPDPERAALQRVLGSVEKGGTS